MKTFHAKRLLKLAKFLKDEVKQNMFDLSIVRVDCKTQEAKKCYGLRRNHCGTVACAMGWAVSIPSFRRAGLELKTSRFDDGIQWSELSYLSFDNFQASAKFFGITFGEADELFNPQEGYETKGHVIKRIRQIVAKYGYANKLN